MENITVKKMTMDQIKALPNMLGRIASVQCQFHGEYKCKIDGIKTHIILEK